MIAGLCACLSASPALARDGGGAQIDREIIALRQDMANLRAEVTELRARLQMANATTAAELIGSAQARQVKLQSGVSELTLQRQDILLETDRITLKADRILIDAADIELRGTVTSKSPAGTILKGSKIGNN